MSLVRNSMSTDPQALGICIQSEIHMKTVIEWVFTVTCKCRPLHIHTRITYVYSVARNTNVVISQVAAPMLPVGDPAMLITVNFFYGNVFYIVRKAKLAWLHLVQP